VLEVKATIDEKDVEQGLLPPVELGSAIIEFTYDKHLKAKGWTFTG